MRAGPVPYGLDQSVASPLPLISPVEIDYPFRSWLSDHEQRQPGSVMHVVSAPRWRALTMMAALVQFLSVSVSAQTPEQLEIFNNLTPEQQQAVLGQFPGQQGDNGVSAAPQGVAADAASDARRAAMFQNREPAVPILGPGDTVLIELALPGSPASSSTPGGTSEGIAAQRQLSRFETLNMVERDSLNELVNRVQSRNPYELDRDARLNLPGLAPIPLGGLSVDQAIQRLSLEPALLALQVQVSRLPVLKTGSSGLKPFGYDLFDNPPSTFSPVTDVPVPADYVIGPGDELSVQLFGTQNRNHILTVSREGTVNFPELGPISLGGMTFNAARGVIESRVQNQRIGVEVSVTMRNTRSIRVFVSGDVRMVGSYTVSGLATMTTALFASGGVKEIGSLRDIQLRRQGRLVASLDLYDLLIRGDTSDDAKLLPGDVIFIPPVGHTVSVEGEVKRPAIYELSGESDVADIVQIAGGFTPEADLRRGSVTRIDPDGRRVVLDLDLDRPAAGDQMLRNGDVLRVARLRPQLDAGVELEGFVYRPGRFAWREGLRLTDVIGSVDELRPGADLHYVLIRRESGPDRRVSLPSADLVAALAAPGSAADIVLSPRDRVIVFELASGRDLIIRPLLEELRLQSSPDRPTELVRVEGSVRVPGEYPLEPDGRISSLLRAGGGLRPSAFGDTAELVRYTVDATGARQTELLTINLAGALRGDASADLLLQPYDHLLVKTIPDWSERDVVTLRGEVRFPGTYPIRKGETLRQLLERAGGLTTHAFPAGSAFTRSDLKELEEELIGRLRDRLREDLAGLALQAANAGQASAGDTLAAGQGLLSQLQSAEATGRFVIDLPGLLAGVQGGEKDIVLRNGDELLVPELRQEVTVIGEVQNATTHLYRSNIDRDQYIAMSGGTSRKADKRRIYVVRADGSVATGGSSRLSRSYDVAIRPGDTIVVPMNAERMPRLPFWQAVTQILYNVAVSVAAVNSF